MNCECSGVNWYTRLGLLGSGFFLFLAWHNKTTKSTLSVVNYKKIENKEIIKKNEGKPFAEDGEMRHFLYFAPLSRRPCLLRARQNR